MSILMKNLHEIGKTPVSNLSQFIEEFKFESYQTKLMTQLWQTYITSPPTTYATNLKTWTYQFIDEEGSSTFSIESDT